jgi:hypothetical protein
MKIFHIGRRVRRAGATVVISARTASRWLLHASSGARSTIAARIPRIARWLRHRYSTAVSRVRPAWRWLRQKAMAVASVLDEELRAIGPRRWRHIGAAAATVLTVVTLGLTWQPNDTWAGTVPSTAQAVGTCHVIETDVERISLSDVRPAVPCDQPHQAETAVVGELPRELRDSLTRMSPERRLMVTNDLCKEPVRAFVGAGPRDGLWSAKVLLRLPTENEWHNGLRQFRCEVTPLDQDQPARIVAIAESLKGILTKPTGATFRRCWTDLTTEVRCDQPHRSESVNSIAAVPDAHFAGAPAAFSTAQRDSFQAWARPVCEPTVSEFLGKAVQETPYRAEAHLTTDGHVLECGVALPDRQPMSTGSVGPASMEKNK